MHEPSKASASLPITGVVLAGGRGTRVGGRDKGLIVWEGRPLVAHVLAHLAPQVDGLLISANRNLAEYAALGHRVVPDLDPGFAGPLAGMLAALAASPTDWLLCVPCDSPWLPGDLAQRLYQAVRRQGAPAAYVVTPSAPLYTHVLLHRNCQAALRAALASDERSARGFLAAAAARPVEFSEWTAPINLNALDASASERGVEGGPARRS